MRKTTKIQLSLVSMLLATSSIYAETGIQELIGLDDEMISIATGEPVPQAISSAVASVITREDFRTYGYRSVAEALSRVTGFHVGISSVSAFPIYSIRGFTSGQGVLFLVNGEPYTASLWGSKETDIGRFPIEMIDRIEVMRGPGSAIYGSDALTAVVNIITRTDKLPDMISIGAGNYKTRSVEGTTGFNVGSSIVNIGIDYFEYDGYSSGVNSDLQTALDAQLQLDPPASLAPGDGIFNANATNINLDIVNREHVLSLRASLTDDTNIGIGLLPILDTQGTTSHNSYSLIYDAPFASGQNFRWTGRGFLKHRRYNLDSVRYFPPGAFGIFADGVVSSVEHHENSYGVDTIGFWSPNMQHNIRFEARAAAVNLEVVDYEANYIKSDEGQFLPDPNGTNDQYKGEKANRTDLSFRLNDEILLSNNWHLSLGFSFDDFSTIGSSFSPRGALVWNRSSSWTFKVLAGRGIRVPAFLETFDIGIPAIVPNADLKPETLTSYDFVTEYRPNSNFALKMNIFRHNTKDQINTTDNGANGLIPLNVGTQKGEGVELEATYSFNKSKNLRVYGHYQENKGQFLPGSPEVEIGYSPHVKAGIQFNHVINRFNYALTYVYTGDRDRPATDPKGPADKYGWLDLSASYSGRSGFIYRLKIENLLDEDSKEANFNAAALYDIDLRERTVVLTIEKTF